MRKINLKSLFSIICGILIATLIYFSAFFYEKQIHNGTLSDRAKAYLKQQQQEQNEDWRSLQSDRGKVSTKADNRSFTIKNCLSFIAPFPVLVIKEDKPCFMMITTSSPRGHIRVYRTTATQKSLHDIGDIAMRRQNTALYHEESKTVGDKVFLLFKRIDEFSYENIAFSLQGSDLYILSMVYPTSENLDKKMYNLVDSLQIL